jgi:PPK2 family polyphosphate:nucleotide phosphotransferase
MSIDRYRVKPGQKFRFKNVDPDDHHFFPDKDDARPETERMLQRLDELQERLYASRERSLLIILQGMDTSGKDGTIRHVMSGVNPQSCQVTAFKAPTPEEAAHDFLWRIHRHTPARGMMGIFNRSHYEDVGITRVHQLISDDEAERRFKAIRHFEKELHHAGTVILKFFLHISKDEQRDRLMARVKDPAKRWKFSLNDVKERAFWSDYRRAYEEAIAETSTEHAPWYVVPANHKWYRNWVVASAVVRALEDMDLKTPKPDPSINFRKIRL